MDNREFWNTYNEYVRDMAKALYDPEIQFKRNATKNVGHLIAGFLDGARTFAPDWAYEDICLAHEIFDLILEEVYNTFLYA